MQRDLRDTELFREIETRAAQWLRPGSGAIVDALELAASPDGRRIAFAGLQVEKLEGVPTTRICTLDRESGELRVLSFGPNTDRLPKWSPDGGTIAYLSDRTAPGDFRTYLLDVASGETRAAAPVEGFVEYLHWAPIGRRLLLGVAAFGADLAGAQGGTSTARKPEALPAWMPELESGADAGDGRSCWVLDVDSGRAERVSPAGLNVWEAAWCGPDHIAAIGSTRAEEEAWYTADLRLIDLNARSVRTLYQPRDQLGSLSASPSGARLAVVEAVCSDRLIVAGDPLLIDAASGTVRRIDTHGVDVTHTVWRSERELSYAGVRAFESVVGVCDASTGLARDVWSTDRATFGNRMYPEVAPLGANARSSALLVESYDAPPRLCVLENGELHELRSFASAVVSEQTEPLVAFEQCRWQAPDGLEIHGWLLRPKTAKGPLPLILDVHGGPVWAHRPRYVGKVSLWWTWLAKGYAVLQPNPRGSSGRGQDYARRVFGDMGGADTYDYLSGIDALIERGIADPKRIGVTGGSYGGFMSSWLITQDQRFAAAAPVAPVTNWVSEHLTCHIPHFCAQFLADDMTTPGGKYFTRSPVMFAKRVKTPTLNVCGALDRNTPPGQAVEFHHALRLNGVESVLVTYPEEGHGVRRMPASFDYAARVVGWFMRHMPPPGARDGTDEGNRSPRS